MVHFNKNNKISLQNSKKFQSVKFTNWSLINIWNQLALLSKNRIGRNQRSDFEYILRRNRMLTVIVLDLGIKEK